MTKSGNHFDGFERSGPITEAELLAAIESGSGPVSDRVEAMRADREALRSLPAEPAPEWLLEAALGEALGEVDSETLRRLEDGKPSSDRLPVSRVMPERFSPERFSIARWLRTHPQRVAFAAVATVVLVVGGIAGLSLRGWLYSSPRPSTPIVFDDSAEIAESSRPDPVSTQSDKDKAGNDRDRRVVEATVQRSGAERPEPTLFEAAALLAEGRLVVLARGGRSRLTGKSLEEMTRHRIGPDHSWSLSAGVPETVLAQIDLPTVEQPVYAMDGTADGSMGDVEIITPERSAWTAKVHTTPTALAALLEGLRDAGLKIELQELAKPIALEPETDPGDVLWWSRPPSSWRRAVALPVVVETLP